LEDIEIAIEHWTKPTNNEINDLIQGNGTKKNIEKLNKISIVKFDKKNWRRTKCGCYSMVHCGLCIEVATIWLMKDLVEWRSMGVHLINDEINH
jgi:hypothetical protein